MTFAKSFLRLSLLSSAKLLCILLPAAFLPFSFILHHFLEQGAYYLDSGFFGYLLTQADWVMTNPPRLGPGEYMATHISPSFWPMQSLAKITGMLPHVALGIWQSLIFVTMALAGVLFIERSQLHADVRQSPWVFLTPLLLPFSGLALSILIYPHTEAMAISAMFLSCALWVEAKRWAKVLAVVVFTFALGVREDVGFHIFAIAMTFLVLAWWSKQLPQSWKVLLAAALIGFVYSVAVLNFQKANFTGDDAFARIYSGQPAWAHLNFLFLAQRLGEMIIHKPYLSVPAIIVIIYSIKKRQLLYVVPLLAYIPWTVVNLAAIAPSAGNMGNYYAYPWLALFIWPLVLLRLKSYDMSPQEQRNYIILCASMLILSIIGFRSAMGKKLFHWMNPVNITLIYDGSYEEHQCAVEKFLKSGSGSKIMGPQYGALFAEAYSKEEVFFEPHEVVGKDYLMLWKNGYFVKKFESHPVISGNYERQFMDESVNEVWRRKGVQEPVIDWEKAFAPCRS